MKAKSIKGKSPEEIKKVLDEAMADGFKPTLALVFLSINQDIKSVCDHLNNHGIAFWGTTTFGEISDGDIMHGGISILLMDVNPESFKIYMEEYETESHLVAANKIATQAQAQFASPIFLITSSQFAINYSKLIKGFTEVIGKDIELFGAVAGDEISYQEGLVFTNSKSSKYGLAALVFDGDKVDIKGTSICGWNPVGTVKTVTESRGGTIYKIDDKPALDITMKYAGIKELPESFEEAVILVSRTLAMQFPKEKGEAVTLVGLMNNEDRSMYTHSEIPVGSKIQFALPADFEVIEEMVERCQGLKSQIPNADAIFIYSCAARLDIIGPLVNHEIEDINSTFNAPLAGLFSNGEIGRSKNGEPDIHNCTTFCVAIKER